MSEANAYDPSSWADGLDGEPLHDEPFAPEPLDDAPLVETVDLGALYARLHDLGDLARSNDAKAAKCQAFANAARAEAERLTDEHVALQEQIAEIERQAEVSGDGVVGK